VNSAVGFEFDPGIVADAAPTISSATHDMNTPAPDHHPMLARLVSGLK
jgi:hypothetical protein